MMQPERCREFFLTHRSVTCQLRTANELLTWALANNVVYIKEFNVDCDDPYAVRESLVLLPRFIVDALVFTFTTLNFDVTQIKEVVTITRHNKLRLSSAFGHRQLVGLGDVLTMPTDCLVLEVVGIEFTGTLDEHWTVSNLQSLELDFSPTAAVQDALFEKLPCLTKLDVNLETPEYLKNHTDLVSRLMSLKLALSGGLDEKSVDDLITLLSNASILEHFSLGAHEATRTTMSAVLAATMRLPRIRAVEVFAAFFSGRNDTHGPPVYIPTSSTLRSLRLKYRHRGIEGTDVVEILELATKMPHLERLTLDMHTCAFVSAHRVVRIEDGLEALAKLVIITDLDTPTFTPLIDLALRSSRLRKLRLNGPSLQRADDAIVAPLQKIMLYAWNGNYSIEFLDNIQYPLCVEKIDVSLPPSPNAGTPDPMPRVLARFAHMQKLRLHNVFRNSAAGNPQIASLLRALPYLTKIDLRFDASCPAIGETLALLPHFPFLHTFYVRSGPGFPYEYDNLAFANAVREHGYLGAISVPLNAHIGDIMDYVRRNRSNLHYKYRTLTSRLLELCDDVTPRSLARIF